MDKRPGVGVGVIIIREGKVLLGKRIGKHGFGAWSFPGGKLEYGEEVAACAERETLEEAGIKITNVRNAPYTNAIYTDEEVHFVTLFVVADFVGGEATVMEPDKFSTWEWFAWDNLPQPLLLPIKQLLSQGFSPFG
jgi:8-oxo-dGTP diphosphatase